MRWHAQGPTGQSIVPGSLDCHGVVVLDTFVFFDGFRTQGIDRIVIYLEYCLSA